MPARIDYDSMENTSTRSRLKFPNSPMCGHHMHNASQDVHQGDPLPKVGRLKDKKTPSVRQEAQAVRVFSFFCQVYLVS